MTSRPLRVGIVGLGTTGGAAARSLLRDALPDLVLTVYDRDPARCEPFRGEATLAASAREALQESDLVVLALPGEREIDRTLDRFSDGRVGADIRDKLLWNLRPLPLEAAERLCHAAGDAGAFYIAGPPGSAMRALPARHRGADVSRLLQAMQTIWDAVAGPR